MQYLSFCHRNDLIPATVEDTRPVGVEVLMAVIIKSTSFWDVMPYSLVELYQSFGRK
jgi:hypothetical protein